MIADPIPFLANIALVAHADGKLSASELGQLEAIRTELKFKKGDFTAAIRLVEQGGHRMTPVGSFADQVLNLEMILRVAYSDDDLDHAEAALVEDFCKAVGIYQDQLDRLCREVMASLKRQGKVCPSCGTSAEADAWFCPKCGTSLASEEAAVQVELNIPASGIAIEFAESSAASFSSALEIAKATQGFQSCQRAKKSWYLAVFPSGSLSDAMPLVQALSGIRNRRVYFDGAEKQWDEVFGFAWCASQRATAYRPVEYCFGKDENRINPWGCKQARMDWTDWASWFSYGRWEKSGFIGSKVQWRFDKDCSASVGMSFSRA
jgi:ribosomal protein L37AE/L43A